MKTCRRLLTLGFAALAALTTASHSRADFEISIYVDGTLIDTFSPGGGGVTSTDAGGSRTYTVDTDTLNTDIAAALPGSSVTIGSLTASTNFPFATGNAQALLKVQGLVNYTAPGSPETVEIVTSANDYLAPTGNPKTMSSSLSGTFTNTAAADSATFYSNFGRSDTLSAVPPGSGPGNPDSTVALTSFSLNLTGGGTSSIGQPTGSLVLTAATPFALTNDTYLTIGNSSFPSSSIQFSGSTTVSGAVPEPASFALVLLGAPLAYGVYRRRKVSKA